MANATEQRKTYSTDLTDEQWAVVGSLIPGAKNTHGGRPQTVCLREVLNTILYLNRTGCQWDMLPHDLLPKSTVYDYFARWRDDGTLVGIAAELRTRIRVDDGREPTPSNCWQRFRQPIFHGCKRSLLTTSITTRNSKSGWRRNVGDGLSK